MAENKRKKAEKEEPMETRKVGEEDRIAVNIKQTTSTTFRGLARLQLGCKQHGRV